VESVALEKKVVNPNGLVFAPAESDYASQPLQPVLPHLRQVLERLRTALAGAGSGADDVLRITCYPTSLDQSASSTRVSGTFPKRLPTSCSLAGRRSIAA